MRMVASKPALYPKPGVLITSASRLNSSGTLPAVLGKGSPYLSAVKWGNAIDGRSTLNTKYLWILIYYDAILNAWLHSLDRFLWNARVRVFGFNFLGFHWLLKMPLYCRVHSPQLADIEHSFITSWLWTQQGSTECISNWHIWTWFFN